MEYPKHQLNVRGKQFEFIHDEPNNRWIIPRSELLLPGFDLGISVNLTSFPGVFSWPLMEQFLEFWIREERNIREQVEACQQIMHTFLAKADSYFFSAEALARIEFWPGSIQFLGMDVYDTTKFRFEVIYFPVDKEDMYEDMGSLLWYASFADFSLVGITRDF